MTEASILWRRLDRPGHEAARLSFADGSWHLAGTAVFTHERRPCRLSYRVSCNPGWETTSARIEGWMGEETIAIDLTVGSARGWLLNGREAPEVAGCVDLDLNFSPSTNLLPIRRLNLAVGEESEVTAAWLRFPGFRLEPLSQSYRRIDAAVYRYQSAGGRFEAELTVNEAGFVTSYPNFCVLEAAT